MNRPSVLNKSICNNYKKKILSKQIVNELLSKAYNLLPKSLFISYSPGYYNNPINITFQSTGDIITRVAATYILSIKIRFHKIEDDQEISFKRK